MGNGPTPGELLTAVPLFPLPNIVLFPRAVLPLHIFEERYKEMTADALAGRRWIAMALLRPGWERDYHGKAAVDPVVCVGTILTHEELPDRRYNFLLQGHTRARIVREVGDYAYRMADLEPIREVPAADEDLASARAAMGELLGAGALAELPVARALRNLLAGDVGTAEVADLLAYNLLEDVPLKQSLLAEPDVRLRIARTIEAVGQLPLPPPTPAARAPRRPYAGPSMN